MQGSLVHRGKNRWALVLDFGYVEDPEPVRAAGSRSGFRSAATRLRPAGS